MTKPGTEDELLARARALAGRNVLEVADSIGRPLPSDPKRAKGFVGDLVERVLGATAGSAHTPDFPELGVELKTIPLSANGRPSESTFLCTLKFGDAMELDFERTRAFAKLRRILFVPVETSKVELAERRFGRAVLYSPTDDERARLERDWALIASHLASGSGDHFDARIGEVMQVRPKASRASVRTILVDEDGPHWWHPRGLYLRPSFTEQILRRCFTNP